MNNIKHISTFSLQIRAALLSPIQKYQETKTTSRYRRTDYQMTDDYLNFTPSLESVEEQESVQL